MIKHQLPAGALDNNYEFFVSDDLHAYCITRGRVIEFKDFDKDIVDAIEIQMHHFPVKIAAYRRMLYQKLGRIPEREEIIKQFLVCNYGGFDNGADMIDGVLQPTEFWPCPFRGTCKFEGEGCDGLKTQTGEFLSKREIEIIQLVAEGYLDKEVASKLNIAKNTVTTHTRNIRNKTGLARKVDFSRFAHVNNLI